MNSRQRIIEAINYRPTDRVPVDFGGHRSSGIAAMAYARLKRHLGIKTGNIYVYDMIQQLAIVEPEILDHFHVDTVELGRAFMLDDKEWKEWVLPDGTPCLIPEFLNVEKVGDDWHLLNDNGLILGIQKKAVWYFEQTHFPLMDRGIENDDFTDLEKALNECMWTATAAPGSSFSLDEKGMKFMERTAMEFRSTTDRAIIGLFGGNLFETPQFLYRSDNYLMAMAMYPEKVIELSERLTGIYLAKLEKWLGACGKYIDIILFGDDFGSNNAPLISPEMYRTYYKPFHTKMWKRVKELADVKIQLHSCGSIEPLLEDLIEAGLDMVNPVQISANGMSATELETKYRGRITFWGGGCDTQHILPTSSPAEIEKHVRTQLNVWKKNGGYVFQQVHNIMANVSPENITAMFKTVNEF
jgi:uroporphyrinogen decarboxylase